MTKKVLVFSDWFIPGFKAGGPIRSLANLIQALPDISFTVITRITDYHSIEAYSEVPEGEFKEVFPNCRVCYLREESLNRLFIRELVIADEYDFIYLNSLFSLKFTIQPLMTLKGIKNLTAKVIVAPRGMLKSGALSVKPWKKKIFITVARISNLFENVRWHATSWTEEQEIRKVFGSKVEVKTAEVLPTSLKPKGLKIEKNKNSLKLVCFSRVSPEKGILEAIQYVNRVPNDYSVFLDIYGSIPEGEYVEKCKKEISVIQPSRVTLKGEVNPVLLEEIYQNYHVFILPTWGENFGHAIAESLMTGTPVIISDKTPWRNLAEAKCGLDLPLDAYSFVEAIMKFSRMDQTEFVEWSRNAASYGELKALDRDVIQQHRNLFE